MDISFVTLRKTEIIVKEREDNRTTSFEQFSVIFSLHLVCIHLISAKLFLSHFDSNGKNCHAWTETEAKIESILSFVGHTSAYIWWKQKTNLGHHFRRTQSLSYYFLCCWSLLKMFPSAVAFHARLALQFSVFVVIRLVLFRVVKTHRKYCTNKWAAVDNGHHLRQSPHLSFRRSYFSWFTTSELWLRFANGICSALKAIRHLSCLNVWDLCKTQASRTWLELISFESRQKMSDFILLHFVQFSYSSEFIGELFKLNAELKDMHREKRRQSRKTKHNKMRCLVKDNSFAVLFALFLFHEWKWMARLPWSWSQSFEYEFGIVQRKFNSIFHRNRCNSSQF